MIGRSLVLCCNKLAFGGGKNSNSVQVELHVNCWKQISKKFKREIVFFASFDCFVFK